MFSVRAGNSLPALPGWLSFGAKFVRFSFNLPQTFKNSHIF